MIIMLLYGTKEVEWTTLDSKIQGEDGCLRREQTYYTDQLG